MRQGATLAILVALLLAGAAQAPTAGAACPSQGDPGAPVTKQVRAMRCLVNAVRRDHGLPALSPATALNRGAARKSADILGCDQFEHEACGRPFTHWVEHFGYRACRAAENIAWGTGPLGSPRSIFRSWMGSPGHRENILGPYREVGIGLRVGRLEGTAGAHVWTQAFGSREC